jgi:hypothetical protein
VKQISLTPSVSASRIACRMLRASIEGSHGSVGSEALIQWVHLRLHQVPVIWIQSVVRRRKGAVGAVAASTSGVSAGLRDGGPTS